MSFVGDFQSNPEETSINNDNSLFIWLDVLGFAEAVDAPTKPSTRFIYSSMPKSYRL